jgi:alcohol dehydrogenase
MPDAELRNAERCDLRHWSTLRPASGIQHSAFGIVMIAFEYAPRTRVVFGVGTFGRVGKLARELGVSRALLVADAGIVAVGYVSAARQALAAAGVAVEVFDAFLENPDSSDAARGASEARRFAPDGIVAVGGGSSLDCAKAINLLLTNGGTMADYRGYGRATRPLLPMLGVPTTAGTGSDAQSYAVIADAATHMKMACGDPGAAFRVVVLDPELTVTAPRSTTAAAGMDAIGHAVETWVTTRRTPLSEVWSREAFRMLAANFVRVLEHPGDLDARGAMLLGSHLAGMAIEGSMLGATHACANPLTARYGTTHGVAIGLLLPAVVQWNTRVVEERYAELAAVAGLPRQARALCTLLEECAAAGAFPEGLRAAHVVEADLPQLAEAAAAQWTGTFNPRPFDVAGALEIYAAAY